MKQITFISGKGGTGKSTLVSSLNILVKDKIIADCDVDAPNLHILLKGNILKKEDYFGAKEAVINKNICIECGLCKNVCRFDAINSELQILSLKCEGCGACKIACHHGAISLNEVKTGETYVSKSNNNTFAHALLDIGSEGSGRLVTKVRKNVYDFKKDEKWILIDGSPGIGCSVIASITGTDAVVVVSEPTMSGLSDLERVLKTTRHFQIPAFVCINKFDLNSEITMKIEEFCVENEFPVIGKIPFEPLIIKALQEFKTPIEANIKNVVDEIENIWERLVIEVEKVNQEDPENKCILENNE
ncbi:MAG: ATP-binding protein [Clostridiales bacterium]